VRDPVKKLASLRYRFHRGMAGKVEAPQSLDTAAKFTGHDLKNPAQRELLLFALAEAIFGRGQVGRPKGRSGNSGGWNVWKLYDLAYCTNNIAEKDFAATPKSQRRSTPITKTSSEHRPTRSADGFLTHAGPTESF
jgi:hypothetical protein